MDLNNQGSAGGPVPPPAISPFPIAFVGGVPFQVTTLGAAADWVVRVAAKQHLSVNVRLANAWNVVLFNKDPGYRRLLKDAGINFPDGAPIAKFINFDHPGHRAGRVRGPSLFTDCIEAGNDLGIRHYLLGGSPETLQRLQEALVIRYPGALVAGSYSPPFKPVDEDYIAECAERIRRTDSDLVWVGLGTPKQDVVGTALADRLKITTLNVGAAFDFVAGTVTEAPVWVQKSGFEWLFRLVSEPRRLWRRYLIGNIQFLYFAICARRAK